MKRRKLIAASMFSSVLFLSCCPLTINPHQYSTIKSQNVVPSAFSGETTFYISEELETPTNPDEIRKNIESVRQGIVENGDISQANKNIFTLLDTFEEKVSSINTKEKLPIDYFQSFFDQFLMSHSEESSTILQSEGVNSFSIRWEKKPFLWFYVNMPVGFEIRLSGAVCRRIVSVGATLALDAIVAYLGASK